MVFIYAELYLKPPLVNCESEILQFFPYHPPLHGSERVQQGKRPKITRFYAGYFHALLELEPDFPLKQKSGVYLQVDAAKANMLNDKEGEETDASEMPDAF